MAIKLTIDFDIKSGMKQIIKVVKQLESLNTEDVEYGYFDNTHHATDNGKSELSNAALMYIQELGSRKRNIPARPVFTLTGETFRDASNSGALQKPLTNFMMSAAQNKDTISELLLDVGIIFKERTQSNFGSGNTIGLQPNHPRVAAAKGRNDPLIDTTTLRDAMEVKTSRGDRA